MVPPDPGQHHVRGVLPLGRGQWRVLLRGKAGPLAGERPQHLDPLGVVLVGGGTGLANTTFRRNFPDITADLARQAAAHRHAPPPSRYDQLQETTVRLRQDNRQLREQLEQAAAVIQRITLESQRLREQLEAAGKVTAIASRTTRLQRRR